MSTMDGEDDLVLGKRVDCNVAAKGKNDRIFIEKAEHIRFWVAVGCDMPTNNFHLILNIKENNGYFSMQVLLSRHNFMV